MMIALPFAIKRGLLSAWLLAFHLAGQGFAPGALLCLSADGWVSVEYPGVGVSCADPTARQQNPAQPATLAAPLPDECCGPCVDLLLPDASVSGCPPGRSPASCHPPFLAWQHPVSAWGAPLAHHVAAALHPSSSRSLPPAHLPRTTVLLI